jgi:hypothetical protein
LAVVGPQATIVRALSVLLLIGFLSRESTIQAQANYEPFLFTTLAGVAGVAGSTDGLSSSARFNKPFGVAVDSTGNVYVADQDNCTIRLITPGGLVSTLAGLSGASGDTDGAGSEARFNSPWGIAADNAGNLYVADRANHTIRKISPAGVVSTLAGMAGVSGSADGAGSAARFFYPRAVAVDGTGNAYVADTFNHTVRMVTPAGLVSTMAGLAGVSGSADGAGSNARFNFLSGIAVDSANNIFVADSGNQTIRKITSGSSVLTLAGSRGLQGSADGIGTAAEFDAPYSLAVDGASNVYVADADNQLIRKVTPAGVVSTLAGLVRSSGSADGIGSAARFFNVRSIAVDSAGNVYLADTSNQTIRKGVQSFGNGTMAATNFATVSGHCQSLVLRSVSLTSGGQPATLNFTTYDGVTTSPPLRQAVAAGVFLYSNELRPRSSGVYETDSSTVFNADGSYAFYSSVVLNLPTTDTDGNGLPDFAQTDKAGATGFTGTLQRDFPSATTIPLTGNFTRNANSITGTYNVVDVATGGSQVNFTGVLELQRYTGSISYLRGAPNTVTFSCQRTNAGVDFSLTGATTFTVMSLNQFTLPSFTLTNATDNAVYTVQAATFNRTGNRYVGALTFSDGDARTAWTDHLNWVFEFTDLNDTDSNGIPNLTDALPTPPTITASSSGNNLTVLWPATAARYRLESATTLSLPISWSNVAGGFQTNAGVISVVQPMSGARRFYRLVEP